MTSATTGLSSPASDPMVFLAKPQVLYVDEDYSVRPPAYGKVDQLMQSLKENGPLVAIGKMGPAAYTEAPFKLKERVSDQDIYGWKPGTSKSSTTPTPVILLGIRQITTKAYVYFVQAQDITQNDKSLIRGYKPSQTDAKVYVMSYDNFLERSLVDLHPICPHGEWLFSIANVNAILDKGAIEKECNEVGQKIFNHYKANANGNSEAGRNAVVRICEAARYLSSDGRIRKSHIESAWDGIGDDNWRWQR